MTYTIDFTQIILAIMGIIVTLVSTWVAKVAVPWLKDRRLFDTAKSLCAVALTTFETNQGEQKFNYVYGVLVDRFGQYFDEAKIKESIQAGYVELCKDLGKIPSKAVTDIK